MTDIPGFFNQFAPPAKPPPPDLALGKYKAISPVTLKSSSEGTRKRKSFSLRDWEFLDFLCEHPNATNGELATLFEVGRAAASARIKRLVGMGLIEVSYEHAEETGEVNRRVINVVSVPPKPWSPE